MISEKQAELAKVITKFADSGWSLIDVPAKAWLQKRFESDREVVRNLIDAIEKADGACGNCGCEFDALYKTVLQSEELLLA
ncbi:MAG: hypothetical protein LBS79_10745 [Tannerella sp.]|nr:hypothetical protein [Tannerella sp.]